ncbi:MAG: AAA-like domain-containing protein, partial [Lachnospiraceae bacterium]|nr:AAA-like domain-containing protein [Lachnospiraceae bacterium]
FTAAFIGQMGKFLSRRKTLREGMDAEAVEQLLSLKENNGLSLNDFFEGLSRLCETAAKPIVLMIDEVDRASNNQVFIDFLAQLRGYYLHRQDMPIFRAVILAGVYDIKNLKLKIRPDQDHQYNSPWNIAASFDVDMDFSAEQIAEMLREYEADHQTGMDILAVAEEIYQYTSGYPYLVSLVCKTIDETLQAKEYLCGRYWWTKEGITKAVNRIMKIRMPLFDSMAKQLDAYPDMRGMLEDIIYQGKRIPFSPDTKSISMGVMFGFLKDQGGQVVVANRIFEMRMLNMFVAEESVNSSAFRYGENNKPQFVSETGLHMELVLEKFVEYFTDIYGDNDEKFVEAYGRKFFLLYLKPIINGTGNYYLEAQTRDASRTDVIVDYLGERYVVELKIWRGDEYNRRGEKQLAEYLDYYRLDKGYLLSFNFSKKKETGVKEIQMGEKVIVEAIV